MKTRLAIVLMALAVTLGAVNWLAFGRERLAADGQVIYLPLEPVDPRSLMQGDYMRLRYAISADVENADLPADGTLVVRLDERQVASFARVHQPGVALAPNERLLRYRLRDSALRIGAESFFFQEGLADLYAEAAFGELRVDPDGEAMLVGLRGAGLQRLGPQ